MISLTTNHPPVNAPSPINAPTPKPKPRKGKTAKGKTAKGTKKQTTKRGGGKALRDFTNDAKIKIVKGKDIARAECFRSGQTVAQCLAAQKKAGLRGRRKYIRKQIALKRITLS